MYLHEERELFEQAVLAVSQKRGIPAAIVEKDYHVTILLKELVHRKPAIIFKGGTSLSKCYHAVNRFSEDIDLSYDNNDSLPTEGMRRDLNQAVMDGALHRGYPLENPDEILRRRHFNRFVLRYTPLFPLIKNVPTTLVVETALAIRSFPTEKRDVASLIGEYAEEAGMAPFVEQYELGPFSVSVQKPERTFVDKIFALCDYWMADQIAGHSRHLYDLCKLYSIVHTEKNMKNLVNEVRALRAESKMCPSPKPECDIKKFLRQIDESDAYKSDYENVTEDLLFEPYPYEMAKNILCTIENMGLF